MVTVSIKVPPPGLRHHLNVYHRHSTVSGTIYCCKCNSKVVSRAFQGVIQGLVHQRCIWVQPYSPKTTDCIAILGPFGNSHNFSIVSVYSHPQNTSIIYYGIPKIYLTEIFWYITWFLYTLKSLNLRYLTLYVPTGNDPREKWRQLNMTRRLLSPSRWLTCVARNAICTG